MMLVMTEDAGGHQEQVDQRVLAYYGGEFDEDQRLVSSSGQGVLEFERTQQLVRERLPAGSRIIDVGGATGVHAAALAGRGDVVVLVDPVVEQVRAAAARGGFVARVGDARELEDEDDAYDGALVLGPLYHLADRDDRLRALGEAVRVVRPGGWVFAAGISRLVATASVCFIRPAIQTSTGGAPVVRAPLPPIWQLLIEDGRGGLTSTGFPAGHFHLAEELEEEAVEAGLVEVEVHGLEGPGGLALDIDGSRDPDLVAAAAVLAQAFATAPGRRDLSPHLLAMGRVPAPKL